MRLRSFLVAVACAGALVACSAPSRGNSTAEAAVQARHQPLTSLPDGTRWRLEAAERDALQVPEAERVTLRIAAERLYGDSGCNQYSAGYTIGADGRIALQPIAATKRGCPGPLGAVERAWFEALRSLQWISRDGDVLRLHLADGDALRFVAAPPETE